MPNLPALNRFRKLVDDISRHYLKTRAVQVQFAWETGRRVVTEEQNGAMRAAYGSGLIPKLSEALTQKYGSGFSENTLRKMRQFYVLNPIQPLAVELDWSDYVELLPVKDPKTRRRLEQRVLKEELDRRELRQLVQKIRSGPGKTPPSEFP